MSTVPPTDRSRPDPDPGHPQVTLVHPATGERVEVDEQLAPLVAALWRAGGATFYGCQGDTVHVPLADQRMRWGVDHAEGDLIGWDAFEAPVALAERAYLVCDFLAVHKLVNAVAVDAHDVLEADPDDVPLELIVRGAEAGRFLVHFPGWAIPVLTAALERLYSPTPPPGRPNRAQRRADARAKRKGRRS